MTDTWGISGGAFLALDVLALLAVVGLSVLLSRDLDRAATTGDRPVGDPDVEELALLAGGRVRVVQTAVARLVDAGVLRVARDRELTATGAPPRGELDTAVAAAVVARPRGATTATVVSDVREHPVFPALEKAAVARGLVHPPAAVRARRRLVALVLLALAAVGVARIAAGLAHGRPVAFLVVLVVITVVAAGVTAAASSLRPTPRGTATLRAARTGLGAGAGRAPSSTVAGVGGVAALVAVGGFAMYPDQEISSLLAAPAGGGSGGDAGGSSCGGSSCGGGCGGGGCGG